MAKPRTTTLSDSKLSNGLNRTIALIAGSGLVKGLEDVLEDFNSVENLKTEHFGTVSKLYWGTFNGKNVFILPRHGETADGKPLRSPAELVRTRGYEANIWHLISVEGVNEIYGFSAVGSLDHDLPLASEGVFAVPVSYGRGLAASQHSFGAHAKNVHANMSDPFNVALRKALVKATEGAGYETSRYTNTPESGGGLYIYNGGDAFETPHEIEAIDKFYSDAPFPRLVGMTTVPEAQLCAQMGVPFAALCSNVNYAEGLSNETLVSHEQTLDVMGVVAPMIVKIAKQLLHNRLG